MSMMSEIHAAMVADGAIHGYEMDAADVALFTRALETVDPYAPETPERVRNLTAARDRARARMTRTLDAYAGAVR